MSNHPRCGTPVTHPIPPLPVSIFSVSLWHQSQNPINRFVSRQPLSLPSLTVGNGHPSNRESRAPKAIASNHAQVLLGVECLCESRHASTPQAQHSLSQLHPIEGGTSADQQTLHWYGDVGVLSHPIGAAWPRCHAQAQHYRGLCWTANLFRVHELTHRVDAPTN